MGTVWAATHVELDTPVAIKFLDDMHSSDVESQTRFRREARATARVRGPNIVQIHDFGVEDHRRFIVMELLQGEDLGARLRRTPRLPIETVRNIVTQVAKALERVHAANIVHRDIKPGNIFVTTDDEGNETIKLVDFGLVHLQSADQGVTMSGVLIGTPQFMAPEQARDCAKVDHRTDLWALGAVAYRALTGQPVVAGNNVVEVLMHIARHSIRPPSNVASDLDEEMDAFFAKALSTSPDDRFQSARELATAFLAIGRDPAQPASRSPFSSSIPGPPRSPVIDDAMGLVTAPGSVAITDKAPSTASAPRPTAAAAPTNHGASAAPTEISVRDVVSAPPLLAAPSWMQPAAPVAVLEPPPLRNDETHGSMTLPRLDGAISDAPWRVASSQADLRTSRKRTTFAIGAVFAAIAVAAVGFRATPDKPHAMIEHTFAIAGARHDSPAAASQPPAAARASKLDPEDDDTDATTAAKAPAKPRREARPTTSARAAESAAKPVDKPAPEATVAPRPTSASDVF